MKKIYQLITLTILCFAGLSAISDAQTTRYAGTYNELTTAITASANGDIIQITNNIVVTAQVTINKSLTIIGNDYTITVPVPGLDEMGRFNTSPSGFRVFEINTAGTNITINNLTLKGGYINGVHPAGGGAIFVSNATASLTLNYCIITQGRAYAGGGGIRNIGILYMNQCYLIRNAANYGGGMVSTGNGAKVYIESSTLVENRTVGSPDGQFGAGGGGAIANAFGDETTERSAMFINNTTLANNTSHASGGGINNKGGLLYFINGSVTGNVVYGITEFSGQYCQGGGISNNQDYSYSIPEGDIYIVNSLLAHNYVAKTGTTSNPTGYALDDLVAYQDNDNVNLYYSIYHASLPGTFGANVSNIKYNGAANGSDNTIFTGGSLSKITNNNGTEIGDAIYRPFLYNNDGSVAPTLKSGSFLLESANRGTRTRYANNNNVNPVVAYYNGSSYVNLTGTSSSGQEVLVDQVGDARPDPPARGAVEGEIATLYMVKVLVATNGTVTGGTFYGDVYAPGTSVTITAIPNSGYQFTRFDYVEGGSGTASTENPYTFSVTGNVTLQPVFSALPVNYYSITYIGNGNTDGVAPANVTFTGSTTIADAGTLVKTGYTFNGWNTQAYGSGTTYAANATYSTAANLTLYAQWTQVPTWNWTGAGGTNWGTSGNWSKSDQSPPTVPTSNDHVYVPNVANDPVIASTATASCNNLTIADGANFTIQSDVSGTGSLITSGTVTGDITIERYVAGSSSLTANKYHLVSVPLAVAENSLSGLFMDAYLFQFLPNSNSWFAMGTSTTTALDETIGYMIYFPNTSKTYSFQGATNNGTFTPTVTYPGLGNGNNFALVPNPYPSNIDWNAASGWTKTNIGASIWLFNSSTGNYGVWNGTSGTNNASRYIAVGQAFFVQTTAASPALVMNNDVRTHTAAAFLKDGNTISNHLRLQAVAGELSDELLVGFDGEASNDYQTGEDALKINGSSKAPQICTIANDYKLSINTLKEFTGSLVIPLHFETTHEGDITLNFSQMDSFTETVSLFLKDELTNQTINLRNQPVYTFSHNPENAASRFKLIFEGAIGIEEVPSDTDKMWIMDHTLYISTTNLTGQQALVEVFNPAGQRLMVKSVVLDDLTTIKMDLSGVVVAKLTSGQKVITTKGILMK